MDQTTLDSQPEDESDDTYNNEYTTVVNYHETLDEMSHSSKNQLLGSEQRIRYKIYHSNMQTTRELKLPTLELVKFGG